MWLAAFQLTPLSVYDLVSVAIVGTSSVVSVVVFTKVSNSRFDLKGRTSGLLLAAAGVLSYLEATTVGSAWLHIFSLTLFYWGSVLYLAGARPALSTVPAGFLVLLAGFPLGGQAESAIVGAALALSSASVLLTWAAGRGPSEVGCGYCSTFEGSGETFCAYCGRMVGRLTSRLPRRKFAGFAAFSVLMLLSLATTLPAVAPAPSVSFLNVGLGGAQGSAASVPLSSWDVKGSALVGNGTVQSYTLVRGGTSIKALVTVSQSSSSAAAALATLRGNTTAGPALPQPLSRDLSSYTLAQDGTTYVGVQGVFSVGRLNGSSLLTSFAAFDLRQNAAAFSADNGSAILGAASSFAAWASTSGAWSPTVERLLPYYQLFFQLAYFVSISVLVVIAFTISRDQELARSRRFDSIAGLSETEDGVLKAFEGAPRRMTGEKLGDHAGTTGPSLISALGELSRRDLVVPSVVLRGGRPAMLWECKLA